MATSYADIYRDTDFREHPDKYRIGIGEQGVLIAQPYKAEILPHWKFKTPADAETSAKTIYDMFKAYGRQHDFAGMDMARKFLQMGFTRSRRYANHANGNKYAKDGSIKPQLDSAMTSDKAKSAEIFYGYYEKAKNDMLYQRLKNDHKQRHELKQS